MPTRLKKLLTAVVCVTLCANAALAKLPREEFIKEYTKTGGVLSQDEFINPPIQARGNPFWAIPNGHFDLDQITLELEEMKDKGFSGADFWDTGPGPHKAGMPAGPAFMGPESTKAIAHTIRQATRLGLETCIDPESSWNAGGSWITPEDASKAVFVSEMVVTGPQKFSKTLPFPSAPGALKGPDGLPVYYKEIAVLAIASDETDAATLVSYTSAHSTEGQWAVANIHDGATSRASNSAVSNALAGWSSAGPPNNEQFIFRLAGEKSHTIDRVVLYNEGQSVQGFNYFAKDFSVLVSTTTDADDAFQEVVRGTLKAEMGAQSFKIAPVRAKYVKLRILSGYNPKFVELSEFEVYAASGKNVALGARKKSFSLASVVDLSERLGDKGHLTWDVPEGKWTILRFISSNTGQRLSCPSPNSDGLILDHLSEGAIRRHFQYIYDKVLKELGRKNFVGTGNLMSELGSYEVRSGHAWTPGFREKFKEYRGYDVVPYLPALFGWTVENAEVTDRFMYDWGKSLSDKVIEGHYIAGTQVSHEYGLMMRAEAGGPGGVAEGLRALGAVDLPQGEFWILPSRTYFIKQIACAAHIYGRKIVDAEAFTGSRHWELGPFEYKPYADRAFYEGLNRFCYHNMTHAHPDGGLPGWVFGWGEHFSLNDTWWSKSKPFHHDYIARTSYMLQQGLFVGDVCYYYGDHGGAQVGPKNYQNPIKGFSYVHSSPSLHIFPNRPELQDDYLGFGYDYDVCNPEVIQTRMCVKEGRIVLPDEMSYELLVLPPRADIDWDVLVKLEELIRAGATVVGAKPTQTNTLTDYPNRDKNVRILADKIWGSCDGKNVKEHAYGKGRVIWGKTPREVLKDRNIGPDFCFQGADKNTDLEFIHRRTANEDIYYVVNKKMRAEDVECTFRVKGKQPELWITDDASVQKVMVYDTVEGGTRIPLHLPPAGSVFVVFRGKASKDNIVSVKQNGKDVFPGGLRVGQELPVLEVHDSEMLAWQAGKYVLTTARGEEKTVAVESVPAPREITGPWEVRFPEGWGAPALKQFDRLISWTEDSDTNIKHFSGTATYHKQFTIPENLINSNMHLVLDLGEVKNLADVWINGQHLGILWKLPFRVDVNGVLKPGKNTLKIELTNLWRNRLIGDANLPKEKRRTNTNIVIPKNAPLLKSGLLGPVRLLAATRVNMEE